MSTEIIGNRYKIEKSLGSGVCGAAFLTTDLRCKTDEKLKVVKKIYVGSLMMEETVSAAHEGNVLKNLSHQNILKFYDSFIDKEFYCMVTEFCDEGDLDMLIQTYREANERFDEELVIDWITEILQAVQYIHLRNILHRDLKTKNIFLKNNQVKLGDFGISKLLANPVDMAETFVGTPFYMSPEVLRHEGYDSKSDIWSVGCILYDLVALEHPFKGTSLLDVVQNITAGTPPPWPHEYSLGLKQVFTKLITRDQSLRPSATEVLATPFLSDHIQKRMNSSIQKREELLNSTTIVKRDKQNLAENVHRRMKLFELRKEAEEKLLRNLLPRDRMRILRQRKADEEALKMKHFVAEHHKETQAQYNAFKNNSNPYLSSVHFGEDKIDRSQSKEVKVARTLTPNGQSNHYRFHDYNPSATMHDDRHVTSEGSKGNDLPLRWTTSFEEMPVTPMKDLSVYELEKNEGSFDDGIPVNPDLAETYYDQFNEFDDVSDIDSSDEDLFIENLRTALNMGEDTIVNRK